MGAFTEKVHEPTAGNESPVSDSRVGPDRVDPVPQGSVGRLVAVNPGIITLR